MLRTLRMLLAVVFSLLLVALYSLGVSPSSYAGDSGDIILASWFGGVAHPPGYPLNIMLGWFFTHLPFEASVAYKANLLAAFIQAGVIGVFFLVVKKLTNNLFISFATSLVLAFNPLFWLYAHIIEVFQLNLLLVMSSVYFLLSWHASVIKRKEKHDLLKMSVLLFGLAVFHHQTSILLFPAYFYFVRATKKDFFKHRMYIFKLFLVFLLGIVPYVFTVFAAFRQTPANWGDPKTLGNLLRLITRADYGTFVPGALFVGGELRNRAISLVNFAFFLKNDFSPLGIYFIFTGAIYTFLRFRHLFFFLLTATFFLGPFFIFYSNFPSSGDQFFTGLWERFILNTYPFFALFLGMGLLFTYNFIISLFKSKLFIKNINLYSFLITLFLFVFPLWMFIKNFEKADLSRFYLGDWLAHDMLASAEPGAIIFTFGDTVVFNTDYYYYTSEKFKDRYVIRPSSLYRPDYRQLLVKQYPALSFPEGFESKDKKNLESSKLLKDLVDANLGKHPIYFSEGLPSVFKYKMVPVGLLRKVVEDKEQAGMMLAELNSGRFLDFAYKEPSPDEYENFLAGHIKGIYYQSYLDIADELYRIGDKAEAEAYISMAIRLISDRKEAHARLVSILTDQGKCDLALEDLELLRRLYPRDYSVLIQMSTLFRNCYEDEGKAQDFAKMAKDLFESERGSDLESF